MSENRINLKKRACGLLMAALLIFLTAFSIGSQIPVANASLNDDLAALEKEVEAAEALEADVVKALDKSDYLLSDELLVKTVSIDNLTVGAKSYKKSSFTTTLKNEGYIPITVIGYKIDNATDGGKNRVYCTLYSFGCNRDTGTVNYGIKNRSSAAAIVKLYAYILCAYQQDEGGAQ